MSGGSGGGATATASVALTTKGDLLTFDTAETRLPIGADTQVLTADSTVADGIKWAAPAAGGSGSLELLDAHIAVGNESTYTYTPAVALDIVNTYSDIMISVELRDRSLSGDLQMVVNGVTANIRQQWLSLASGALTNGWDNGANLFFEIINGGALQVKSIIHIGGAAGTGGDINALIDTYQDHDILFKSSGNVINAAANTITSIKFTLGAGTWNADSTITTYGLKRT